MHVDELHIDEETAAGSRLQTRLWTSFRRGTIWTRSLETLCDVTLTSARMVARRSPGVPTSHGPRLVLPRIKPRNESARPQHADSHPLRPRTPPSGASVIGRFCDREHPACELMSKEENVLMNGQRR